MKKIIIFAGILFVVTPILVYLFSYQCASCAYRSNNLTNYGVCTEICIETPTWKILLFNLTGKRFDLNHPAITYSNSNK
jgi:hypothetical protein